MSKTIAHYPLSSPQKEIWLDQIRHADTPLYNIGGYVRIDGPVNHSLFEQSISTVIKENDALRIVLHEETPLPTLKFSENVNVKVDFHDFSSEEDPHQHAIKWMETELGTPFQLYGKRLSQFALIKASEECYYLFGKYHHLIMDGWGNSLFFQHVAKQYDALVAGDASDKQPRYSYRSFIQDDKKYLESDAYKRHERYWQEKFRDLPEPLMISPKVGKVKGKVFPSHRKTLTLKWDLYHRLITFAKNNKATTFHLFLGVLYTYFIRTSDGENFVIGLPVLNRKSAAFKRTMGLFTGVTPARFHLGTALNFVELMQSINAALRKDYRHQRFPLGDINKLAELHKVSRRQLFDITLSYQKHDYLTTFAGNPAKVVTVPNGFEQSAMAVAIEEYQENQEVRVTFDYNLDAFDEAEIDRIVARVESLLGEVLERSTVPIRELNLMPAEERRKVLFEFNDTAVPYPFDKTIVDLFEEQVEKTPHNVAVVFENQQLTYQELNTRANQLAHYLQILGVKPEVLVGIYLERSIEMVIGLLGILKAGGAYLPLDPAYPAARLAFMLEDAQVSVLLTQSSLKEDLPETTAKVVCLDAEALALSRYCSENPVNGVTPTNLAYVIYTSGSTGQPKGAMNTHRGICNRLLWMQEAYQLVATDNVLQKTPFSFDVSVWEFFWPLLVGARLVVAKPGGHKDSNYLVKLIIQQNITTLHFVPSMLQVFVQEQDLENCRSLRQVICSGEALPFELQERLFARLPAVELHNLYGPTEATVDVTYWQCQRDSHLNKVPIGRPIANIQIYILDQYLQQLPIDVPGELHIGGAGLARGYLNRPDLTAEKFINNPFDDKPNSRLYKTGDLARYMPDGNIEYLGRIDNQVKIRGFRIEPGEIEQCLRQYPEVGDAVVLATDSSQGELALTAYVTQRSSVELWPSIAEFFVYDEIVYHSMSSHESRNQRYLSAFKKVLMGKKVVEIGPGPDVILSRLCLEAGAVKVYAIEILEKTYKKAQETVKSLGLENRIILIHGDAITVELPEKVDYCISEIVGAIGGAEGAAKIINNARRFLHDPCCMIPQRSLTKIAALTFPENRFYYGFSDIAAHYVEKIFEQVGYRFDLRVCLKNIPQEYLISNTGIFEDIDYTKEVPLELEHEIILTFKTDAQFNGLLIWLTLYTDSEHVVDILDEPESWLPVYFPVFDLGVPVKKGDMIKATISRKLCVNALNPDYFIQGQVIRQVADNLSFQYHAYHFEAVYKNSPFYEKLFADDTIPVRPKFSSHTLRNYLENQLPSYMLPSYFIELPNFPLTPNGKIDRRTLERLSLDDYQLSEETFVAPRTPEEELLASIWASVLSIERVGVHDNFFELGGHSLLATQVISRIRETFSCELPLRHLFESPTISNLAAQIKTSRLSQPAAPQIQAQVIERSESLPLSFAQQRLWLFNQLEEGYSATYNIPAAIRLKGKLHVTALEKSLTHIVQRHETLRTTFVMTDGTLTQTIHPLSVINYQLSILYLQNLPTEEQATKVKQLASEEGQHPFDLAKGPLLRTTLLQLGSQEHVLLVTMHHIISDGWSIGVFIREFVSLYEAFSKGESSPLTPLPVQYVDFAHWQRQWLTGEVLETQVNYWQQQLAGTPPLLELPTDRPRPSIQTARGCVQRFEINKELTRQLKKISHQNGATLFMTLLSAFIILLYRYSGQEDIVVGYPIANRNRNEIESLIGFFINTLVLRTNLSGTPRFNQLLNQVRKVSLEAYAHQDIPFEKLVEVLQTERNLSHSPLFQVMFVLQNAPMEQLELSNLKLTVLDREFVTTQFDLTFFMEETEQGLKSDLVYNSDLFNADTISRMAEHFQTLLTGIVADPMQSIAELPLLTKAEQHQLLVEWNNTTAVYRKDKCIHQLFEEQVENTPDAVAVVFENQQLSYQELNVRANKLAHHLQSLGVKPEVLVGICVERSFEMIIGLLGIIKAGGAYVPLDPTYPPERLAFMLEEAEAPVLLTQHTLMAYLPKQKAQVICLDSHKEIFSKANTNNIVSGVQPENLAYVIYTSGSTGQPKGVLLEHQGLCNLAKAQIQSFHVQRYSRVLQFASISFDASISEIVMALGSGATLYLETANSLLPGPDLIQLLRELAITHVTLPPAALAVLPIEKLSNLQYIIVAGEACSPDLAAQWSPNRHFFNAYGPTEDTVCSTIFEYTAGHSNSTLPMGRPIANTKIYILDKHLQPVPVGIPGELHISGVGLARGYLNRPELTAEKFIPNPFSDEPDSCLYKTGDLARYMPDGNIEFLDRIDNQVKLRGFRIELGEIEALLSQHPKVRETVVIVREDKPGNQQLVAYFVSDHTPERIPYQSECLVEHEGKVLTLYTEDISGSGICLQQDESGTLKEGNEINLHLLLPNESDAHWFKGKVIWSRDTWAGVKFTQSEQALIDRSIEFLLESTGLLTAIQRLLVGNLRHYLENKVPSYMVPTHFVLLNSLPLTPNGKINRRALPLPAASATEYASSIKTELLPQTEMENVIAAIWKEILQIEQVGIYDQFFELGGHSLMIAQLQSKLQNKLGQEIPMAKLFEYPTIHAFAEYLSEERSISLPEQQSLQKSPRHTYQAAHDIAIIGMAGRFPGAKDIDAFWHNLQDGVESITFFSDEELRSSGIDSAILSQPNYVKASGILLDVEQFDATFFGFSPKEAEMMDPQHRLFLECAWTALENAGIKAGTEEYSVGVYAGVGMNTYLLENLYPNRQSLDSIGNYQLMIGNSTDFLPTRVSYKLNLKGPSVNVQTACSTSLVATHSACKSLLDGGCDVALAGGVSIHVPQKTGYLYQEDMIMSPDGHCRAFDAAAQGTVGGNGVGVVVLKRLEDAIADGDTIHAIIKGSAINNDGSMKVGYTAPSVEGQAAVISDAVDNANIEPDTIRLIETHGTGTKLGDPIEIAALNKVFRKHTRGHTQKKGFCALGSVKTNIGHTDAAAGVAGLIKTVLALKHQLLPPSLHFEQPNPHIDFANSPFYVNTKLSEWKAIDGKPRRAGVSSFGIGGTNAHVILEEAPISEPSEESRPWQLLVLSAKTESALDTATANLSTYLEQHPESNLADVAYTLIKGRQTFNYRRILVCQAHDEAIPALRTVDPKSILTHFQESVDRPVVFMFSGQGTQYVNMGLELYQTEAIFQEQIELCAEYLKPHLGFDLRQVLYPSEAQISEAEQQLKQTAIIQPALFVIEYALAKLWMAWGVQPDAMIGHSIGEYVAACLSGVFTLEEALSLIVARGQFMQQLPRGAMLSVSLSELEVQPLLGKELSLAAHNTPSDCVVSGTSEAVETIEKKLTEQGVECCRLRTFRAFHSKMMEPILGSFTDWVKQVRLCPPQIPYLSNVTGSWMNAEEALDHRYWANHLRQTVRFADGIQELLKKPERIFLEVGPGRTLSTLVKRHPDKVAKQVVLSSLRHPKEEKRSDGMFLLNTLGKLWLAGGQLDWSGFYAHEHRHRLPLPTYPFEHQRYWIDSPKTDTKQVSQVSQVSQASQDKKRDDIADWFYRPFWKPSVLTAPTKNGNNGNLTSWLVFENASGLGAQLVKKLEQQDKEVIEVITVQVGSTFSKQNSHNYTLNPQQRNDYDALVNALKTSKKIPQTIVHLWCVTQNTRQDAIIEKVDKAQELGFYSLLFIAQALGKQNVTDEISIAMVSNNMQAVTGKEALHPEKATVLGPVKVIGQEYPNLSCCSIDVIIPSSESENQLKLIEQLLVELTTKSSDRVIAYRGEHRWVQDFEPVHLDKPIDGTPRLRERGVYLITGGLGGIGITLAEHLAKTVQAKLILIGRSAFPAKEEWPDWLTTHDEHDGISRKIKKVQALETQGAEVFVASADVADLPQMQEVITAAKQRFGSLNGVIHSAGVPDGALIPHRTREMTETVFAPKVTGTLVLDNLLQNVELDFFILCSSLASIFGIGGQIGYCAANAFLDAFAHFKKTKKDSLQAQATVAINWDTWQEVGMAVKSAKKSLSVFDSSKLLSKKTREFSHPLFNECIIEGLNQERYISHLNVSQHWVLDDHRIMGKAVLPGTAYLELARAAFEPHAQSGIVEIRDIYFLHPLIVEDDEPKEVHTRLTKQGNSLEFEFVISSYSAPDTWQEHARGFIACIAAQPAKKHDIKAITSECDQQEIIIDPEFVQKPLAELSGFEAQLKHFGPHWYNLQQVKLGTHQGLAILELPKDFTADLTDYQLHPALLDIATGFIKFHEPEQSSLPFSYKRLTIKAPLPAKIYSYVRYANTQNTQTGMLQFNVTLMDEQGMELVDIEEYTLREVEIDTATYQQYQAQREKVAPPEKNQNFHLEIVTPGLLDTLTFRPIARHQPKPDEVEIEVCATGLNFKEVLYAVGLLQAPADCQVKFGLECAGRIVTVGNNVKDFQVNDEIIAFAPASFSAFTTTPATSIVPKPNNLSFEEAATIPIAFVTAYYALIKIGRLSKGERILIHAAAGGVGMAAVKIAQWMGAEIFSTAGNPEKRAFLHSLGIQYVMDSRSLAFADEVMEYTKGKGVDVVLNSLGGEFIPKSLETLAPFGRFLELGIRDIHNNTQLGIRPFEKGLTYSFVNVGQETPHFQIIFQEIVQHFNEGHFSPLPHKVFSATDVASAFDYMAQTKHIGKIVVSLQDDKDTIITQDTETLQSNKTDLQSRKSFVSKRETKETAVTNLVQQNLKEGLLPIEGVDVFGRILGSTQSQIIVSTRDIHSRLEQDSVSTMLSSMKNAEPVPLSKPTHSRPQLGQAYVAPRNEIERKMADIWQQFLGVEEVGIYDDFFDLGGNSLLAVQLIAKLREVLQIDLSAQSLLNTSTVAALAEFLGETTPELSKQLTRQVLPSSLVEIQAGNSLKPPLFLVHPWGGHVYVYRDLAYLLGSEIPVYGIQAQGVDGEKNPLIRVEEMATHYIEYMRVRQPEGPYFIGGSSFGGMVAFEIAQQLHALDQKVALLTMMDTPGPSQMPIKFETDEEMLAYTLNMGANVSVSIDELRKLKPDEQLRYILEKQKKMEKQLLPDMDITQARHFLNILKANAQAMWEYKPRVYQERIIFFRAKEKDAYNAKAPERAWINLAQKGLTVIDVPGNHFTMNYPPHVQVMAERLIPYLA